MMVIRPIRADDYPALYDIAVESGHGFTSLPVNDELLMLSSPSALPGAAGAVAGQPAAAEPAAACPR